MRSVATDTGERHLSLTLAVRARDAGRSPRARMAHHPEYVRGTEQTIGETFLPLSLRR